MTSVNDRVVLVTGANGTGKELVANALQAAKEAWRAGDWAHGRFRLPPGDDAEFIPLPD